MLRGSADEIAGWGASLDAVYAPRRLRFAIRADEANLPEALAVREPRGDAVAYVCRGTACTAPLTSLEALAAELKESS